MTDAPRGAHVEIVDPKAISGPLAPSKVLINGVDVGIVAKDSVQIVVGDSGTVTEVTLTLYPSRITFRGADEPEGAFKRWGSVTDPEPPPPPR